MKKHDKLFAVLSPVLMAVLLLMGISFRAEAARIPKKMRAEVGMVSYYHMELPNWGDTIKNVKSKSKQLRVKYTSNSQSKWKGSENNSKTAGIQVYTKKKGTYKFTYQIVGTNKKVSKRTVTVYAGVDPAFKSVTFAGKKMEYGKYSVVTGKKSGKFQVKMNPGNKLKKIEVTTVKGNETQTSEYGSTTTKSVETTKKIKNGGTIKLGTKGYYYCSQYGQAADSYHNYYLNTSLEANTTIKVTYHDKYTGLDETAIFTMTRLW